MVIDNFLSVLIAVIAILTSIRAFTHRRYILGSSLVLLIFIPLRRFGIVPTYFAQVMVNIAVFGVFYKINWFLERYHDDEGVVINKRK